MRPLAVLVCALALAPGAGATRVLFVGNSLTEANRLPAMVAQLAPVEVDARVVGGYALEDHWNLTDIADVIARGRYDLVVLQQGPSSLPESRANLLQWSHTFADAIRAAGGTPAFYTVWPESWRRSAFDAVISSYRAAARDTAGLLLPVGVAWKSVLRTHPKLALYGPDGFHPTRLGSYLAAVTIAAGLTKRSPVGLPRLGVPAKTALVLQRAAAAALRSA
jgi:hypothetical protein